MLARYILAWGVVFGLVALLVPACAASIDSAAPEEARTAEAQQKDEAPIDVTKRFMCKGLDIVECMIRCADQGTACKPRRKHPYKAAAGYGDLYACRTEAPRSCDYRYANGGRCSSTRSPTSLYATIAAVRSSVLRRRR